MSAEDAASKFRRMTGGGKIDIHRNQLAGGGQDVPTAKPGTFQLEKGTIGGEALHIEHANAISEEVVRAKRERLNRRVKYALRANPTRGIKPEVTDENDDLPQKTFGDPKKRLQRALAALPEEVQREARQLTAQPDAAVHAYVDALEDITKAKKARAHLWKNGYQPVGSSPLSVFGGDAAMLTHEGLAVFQKFGTAGLDHPNKDSVSDKTAPDDLLSFEDIAQGHVNFTVGDREARGGNGLALAKLLLGKRIDRGSVVVTTPTGRQYTLMDVPEPEAFCRNVRATAQAVHDEGEAYRTIAELQAAHPELFTNSE